jgi:hypothetical protein
LPERPSLASVLKLSEGKSKKRDSDQEQTSADSSTSEEDKYWSMTKLKKSLNQIDTG